MHHHTTATLAHTIGRIGALTTERSQLSIRVRVIDARTVYNRTDFQIEPTDGTGRAWVDAARVRLDGTQE